MHHTNNAEEQVETMNKVRRIPLATLFLAGASLGLVTPSLAQHPVAHAPAVHAHPAAHPAPFHRPAPFHVARPGFHALHAALVAHVPFARFTPAQRAVWTHGTWFHRWWNGRYGWWWDAGGVWFWYGAPVYPYPTVVSDYYYEEPESNEPPAWYYCYNPPGYYPYVPTCYGQWQPVPAQGYGGDDQGPPPSDQSQSYGNGQGRPPGYGQGPPPDYYDQGPPPGYEQGPPGYEQGPPPGYDQGPPPGYDGGDQQPPNNQQESQ